ncbi:MAG: flagellar basal body P-ring formation chaperone FlgA [Cellvibrio sp.]
MELPSFYRTFLRNILRHSSGVAAASALLITYSSTIGAAPVYPPLQLKQDIASFLAKEYSTIEHERIDISVSNLDNRLRLETCASPPIFTTQDTTGYGGNISVKATCESGKKWSVHVPAQVNIYRPTPVAQGNIARGELITGEHITSQLMNISDIRQAFLTTTSDIIGKQAKRNISRGEPFKSAALDAPTAIKRGEIIILEALAGSIKVSSAGTAMTDGRIGQTIRVRNNSSERIISGIVVRQGVVQTL